MKLRLKETESHEDFYLRIILSRIEVCKDYRPKFGQGRQSGLSLREFQELYRADTFYEWFGLDDPLMYAAHKAAGGITSIYRQIGLGCEEVFRQILQDHLGLTASQSEWNYTLPAASGRIRKLSLDGRLTVADISQTERQARIQEWLLQASSLLQIAPEIAAVLKGAVFEVRQGYKSKDSKRQNADIANAATAYSQGYLPVALILSSQIDSDVAARYQSEKWLLLRGSLTGSPLQSTYTFCRHVVGYDLGAFFQQNSQTIKRHVEDVLKALLASHD